MRHKGIDEAKVINLDRCIEASDRQRAVSRRTQALLAAAGMDVDIDVDHYVDLKRKKTSEERAIRIANIARASRAGMTEAAKVRWVCLEVTSGRETSVNKALDRANIETLIPWLPETEAIRRGRKVTIPPRALYDGYVFVHCGITPEAMQGLGEIKHVVGIVGGAENPHVIGLNVINNIMRLVITDEVMLIDNIGVDDKVYVTKGLYVFLEGVVLKVKKRRAKIEISYEGRKHVIEMPLAYVRKL